MPLAVSSRASASSPDMRSDRSSLITSAATFWPLKLVVRASGAPQVEVNFTAPSDATAAANSASVENRRSRRALESIDRSYPPNGGEVYLGNPACQLRT